MTTPPQKIWAFYAPEVEVDEPGCTIVAIGKNVTAQQTEIEAASRMVRDAKAAADGWEKMYFRMRGNCDTESRLRYKAENAVFFWKAVSFSMGITALLSAIFV